MKLLVRPLSSQSPVVASDLCISIGAQISDSILTRRSLCLTMMAVVIRTNRRLQEGPRSVSLSLVCSTDRTTAAYAASTFIRSTTTSSSWSVWCTTIGTPTLRTSTASTAASSCKCSRRLSFRASVRITIQQQHRRRSKLTKIRVWHYPSLQQVTPPNCHSTELQAYSKVLRYQRFKTNLFTSNQSSNMEAIMSNHRCVKNGKDPTTIMLSATI